MSGGGTTRECILTGVHFRSEDPDKKICDIAVDNIVREISRNAKFREEMVSAILQDSICVQHLAKAVLSCRAVDAGLQTPGTIAEFFSRLRDRKALKKASKVS